MDETPENLRYSYLDKFQVLAGPMELPPNKCAGCGYALVSRDDRYVDWGFDVEFYGQVAMCLDCFRQAANQLGFMDPGQWKKLIERGEQQLQMVIRLTAQVRELKNALASIEFINNSDSNHYLAELESVQEPEPGPVDNPSVDEAEPGPDESDDESGPTDVSSNDTLNELLGNTI